MLWLMKVMTANYNMILAESKKNIHFLKFMQ